MTYYLLLTIDYLLLTADRVLHTAAKEGTLQVGDALVGVDGVACQGVAEVTDQLLTAETAKLLFKAHCRLITITHS